jgi:hypothetical protein
MKKETIMSTDMIPTGENAPASLNDLTDEQRAMLAKATGQAADQGGNQLPKLRVNYDAEWVDENNADAEPVALKRGYFKVSIKTDDETYTTAYSKTAEVHPYHKTTMYSIYDNDNPAAGLATTRFVEWNDVILDTWGGEVQAMKYGKTMRKQYPHLDTKPSPLKCITSVYCTVTLPDAVDMNGTPVEIVNLPCEWQTKGSSFMPTVEAFDALKKQGKLFQAHSFKLTTKREKNDGTVYFVTHPELAKDEVGFTAEDFTLLNEFIKTVEAEDQQVIKKFKEAKAKATDDDLGAEISDASLDDFGDDLDGTVLYAG